MVAARAWNTASAAVVGDCVAGVCVVLSVVDGVPDPEVLVVPEAGGVVVPAELLLAGVLDVEADDDDCDCVLVPDALGGVLDVEAGGDDDCVLVPDELGGGVVLLAGVVVGVVGEGVGVVVVGVGVVVGGGVDAGTCTSWHCQITGELVTDPPTPPPGAIVAAMPAGANAALAAKPAVAVKSVPPAMKPIATGRTRAKHM